MPAIQRIFRRVPFTRDRFKAAAHFDCPKWPPANLPRVVYHPTKGNTHQQIVTLMDLLDKVPCMHTKTRHKPSVAKHRPQNSGFIFTIFATSYIWVQIRQLELY